MGRQGCDVNAKRGKKIAGEGKKGQSERCLTG